MNLTSKRELAARTLKVGKERIVFVTSRINEIKEAITKQDIRELNKEGAIKIKEINGTKTKENKKKRTPGNVRKRVNTRKQDYVKLTRKLRKYITEMKNQGKIDSEKVKELRRKIRNKIFRSKSHLKNILEE